MEYNGFALFMPSVPLLPYPHGQSLHFRRYVLLPPLSFGQIAHGEAESFPPCQRRLQRVALADTHGAADLLGDDHPAQFINAADDSGCFHLCTILPILHFPMLCSYYVEAAGKYTPASPVFAKQGRL